MSIDILKARRKTLAARLAGKDGSADGRPARAVPPLPAPARSPLVGVFLVSLVVPFQIGLGPLQLSASRAVLLVALLPLLRKVFLGAAGRLNLADVSLAALCAAVGVSMIVNHGWSSTAVEYTGVFTVETLGAYLLARLLIRTPDAFESAFRVYFWIIVALMPFAVVEATTGANIPLRAANAILPSQPEITHPRRLGFDRVQSTLDHPIHFAVFCAAVLPLVALVLGFRGRLFPRLGRTALVAAGAFLGASSGAVLMMAAQLGLIVWHAALRRLRERWLILAAALAALVAVEFATGVFVRFAIDVVAFDPRTAFNRTRIFAWGIHNIGLNPWFGIGHGEWVNPPGMSDSVDMFWIERGVMHGLPAAAFNLFAFAWLVLTVALRPMPTDRLAAYKMGYLVTMAGLFVVSWTVHLWREIYVVYFFLLGSGAWLLSVEEFVPVTRRRSSARRWGFVLPAD